MTPSTRRGTKHLRKYDRHELTVAISAGVAILLFTAIMVWVLGPHDSGGSSPPPTTTPAAATTTTPTGSTDTTPGGSTATTVAPASSTSVPAGG